MTRQEAVMVLEGLLGHKQVTDVLTNEEVEAIRTLIDRQPVQMELPFNESPLSRTARQILQERTDAYHQ